MEKEIGNFNPLNEEKFFEDFESLEEDARKEKVRSILNERNEIADKNRKLFARAKEAEGFKQDEDGTWIKTIEKKPEAKSGKSDEELLKRLDTMALKMAGITADDEKELFEKWKTDTGRDADSIVGNKIFQSELADLRTAKANAAATADIKGEGKASGEKSDPAYWIAKATKDNSGELVFPEELPNDYKLRAAILEKMAESSKENKQFYNS